MTQYKLGWEPESRTLIGGFKDRRLAVRRTPNINLVPEPRVERGPSRFQRGVQTTYTTPAYGGSIRIRT